MKKNTKQSYDDLTESIQLEGKHSVREALRAEQPIERIFVLKDAHDGQIQSIIHDAKKSGIPVDLITKDRLDQLSETDHHQGVVVRLAAFHYSELSDVFDNLQNDEDPFLFLLDGIEDPHNLGAIIRTAHQAGAHAVIIPKRRSSGLNATAVSASAGAVHHIPVVRVTNLTDTIKELKSKGIWFACADMDGEIMYKQNLTGPIGLIIGSEGSGVSRLVRENCDMIVSIPMKGKIDSLNASVAAGVLAYEVVRQRMQA